MRKQISVARARVHFAKKETKVSLVTRARFEEIHSLCLFFYSLLPNVNNTLACKSATHTQGNASLSSSSSSSWSCALRHERYALVMQQQQQQRRLFFSLLAQKFKIRWGGPETHLVFWDSSATCAHLKLSRAPLVIATMRTRTHTDQCCATSAAANFIIKLEQARFFSLLSFLMHITQHCAKKVTHAESSHFGH